MYSSVNKYQFKHSSRWFPVVESYEEAKNLYETTTPLSRQVHADMDIRPVGRRQDRVFRIVKAKGRSFYTLTCNYQMSRGYDYTVPYITAYGSVQKRLGDLPGIRYYSNGTIKFHKIWESNKWQTRWLGALDFYSNVLPSNMALCRFDTKIYLHVITATNESKFYLTSDKLKIEKVDDVWAVTGGMVQEYKYRRIRKSLPSKYPNYKKFTEYAELMWDLLDVNDCIEATSGLSVRDVEWGTKVASGIKDKKNWLACVQAVKSSARIYNYNLSQYMYVKKWPADILPKQILRLLVKANPRTIAKYFTKEEVPLGEVVRRSPLEKVR